MDRKSIIVIAVCVILLVVWQFFIMPKLSHPVMAPAGATNAVAAATNFATTNASSTASPAPAPAPAANPLVLNINTNEPEQLLVVTNENARYVFTSYGGGLKEVELLKYPETVSGGKGDDSSNQVATLNEFSPAPTLAVLDGQELQGDGVFHLERTSTGVRATKTLTNGLTLVKEFSPTTNYLMDATARIENRSSNSIAIPGQSWVIGTANPMNPEDRGTYYIGMMWSDGKKAHDITGSSYFSAHGFACIPKTPPTEYRTGESNITWAAVHNQFFALAVIPKGPAADVVMREVNLPQYGQKPLAYSTNGYIAALVYPSTSIPAGGSVQHQFLLYAGPKEYRTLSNLALQLKNNLDAIMNFGFFAFFAKGLLLIMNFLHGLLKIPYGWAVVVITFALRMVFWPLTAASTRSMKRMQTLQPQMNAIKEKYKDDPAKMNKKVMEFMKENKVNPMSGCLPMLVQMPVFFGFYGMLRCAIELRGARFLWVSDLAKPDTLFVIPGLTFIPFFSGPDGLPINLLPLLMVGVMVWQAHLSPPSPGMDPAQQKLMRYMPAFFLLFLYNYSSGMALYIFVSTVLSIFQTKVTKTQQPAPAPAAAPALTRPKKKRK